MLYYNYNNTQGGSNAMKLTYREWEHLIKLVQAELDNKDTPPHIKLLDIAILQELEGREMG